MQANYKYLYRYYVPDTLPLINVKNANGKTIKVYYYSDSMKFSRGPGCHYRYILVDSLSGHNVVGAGQTTEGKLVNKFHKDNGRSGLYDGTNPTGSDAYVFEWGTDGDLPFFNKGIVIKSIEG